jgi:hypothetical protein
MKHEDDGFAKIVTTQAVGLGCSSITSARVASSVKTWLVDGIPAQLRTEITPVLIFGKFRVLHISLRR